MSRNGARRVQVLYDQDCGLCTRTARLLRRLDRRRNLELVSFEEAQQRHLAPTLTPSELLASFHAVLPHRVVSGADAIPVVLERLPLGTVPARVIRGSRLARWVTRRTYDWVARNRWRFGACRCERPA